MTATSKLGLLAVSAGISALIVALVMPYTEPEALAALSKHPVGGLALNTTIAAFWSFARLLEAATSASPNTGPNLSQYYPLLHGSNSTGATGNTKRGSAAAIADADLDWWDPEVWRLQQQAVAEPYYTEEEVARLLYWCQHGNSSSSSSSSGSGAHSRNINGAVTGATTAEAMTEAGSGDAAAAARFRRLADWVAAAGGDASRVQLGTSEQGVRGLHASQALSPGDVALAVPLRLGLSVATFRAARMVSAATAAWREVPDADLFLDALALSYEVAVHGERSPWAQHLCMLPRTYGGLPVHASDPRDAELLSHLPNIRRLAAKRRAQLALVSEHLARPALLALPGGRSALVRLARGLYGTAPSSSGAPSGGGAAASSGGRGDGGGHRGSGRDLWLPLWHWAYAAAKTRAVTLATEEVRAGSGSGGGGGGVAAGAGGEAAVLGFLTLPPPAPLGWVQEIGALLPLLDLANHAFQGGAEAGGGGAAAANTAYQLLPASSGGGLVAALVATSHIAAGAPLTFDYLAAQEAELQGAPAACPDRWLLEYGFVPDSPAGDPRRDCDTFTVSAADLATAVARAAATTAAAAAADNKIQARLACLSTSPPPGVLPSRLEIRVRQPSPDEVEVGEGESLVRRRWEVVRRLEAALQLLLRGRSGVNSPGDGMNSNCGEEGTGEGSSGAGNCRGEEGRMKEAVGGEGGVEGVEAGDLDLHLQVDAEAVLRELLRGRAEELGWLEEQATSGGVGGGSAGVKTGAAAGSDGQQGGELGASSSSGGAKAGGGGGGSEELRRGVAAVAAAARRAVLRALEHEEAAAAGQGRRRR